jgi:hypothetical protein
MVFEEIQQRLDQDLEEYKDDEEREREEKKHHLYQLKQQYFPVLKPTTGSSCRYCSNCCFNWYR